MAIKLACLGGYSIGPGITEYGWCEWNYYTANQQQYDCTDQYISHAAADRHIIVSGFGSSTSGYSDMTWITLNDMDPIDYLEGSTTGSTNGWIGWYMFREPAATQYATISMRFSTTVARASLIAYAVWGLRNSQFYNEYMQNGAMSSYWNEAYLDVGAHSLTLATLGTLGGGSVTWDMDNCVPNDVAFSYESNAAGHSTTYCYHNDREYDVFCGTYCTAITSSRSCLIAVNLR